MPEKISLYECFNAKVVFNHICCSKGHPLMGKQDNIGIVRLVRGEPLVFTSCQGCPDFERMGGPVAPAERGWASRKLPDLAG